MLEAGKHSDLAVLTERDSDSVTIKINDAFEKYRVLKVIEFDSDRKMMTVIAKNTDNNKVYVFTKGADMAILPRIKD